MKIKLIEFCAAAVLVLILIGLLLPAWLAFQRVGVEIKQDKTLIQNTILDHNLSIMNITNDISGLYIYVLSYDNKKSLLVRHMNGSNMVAIPLENKEAEHDNTR